MKRVTMRFLPLLLVILMLLSVLAGCGYQQPNYDSNMNGTSDNPYYSGAEGVLDFQEIGGTDPDQNDETETIPENAFIDTSRQNVSTFSADVDTASYAYFRKTVNNLLRQGADPAAILKRLRGYATNFRTEEFLNYFRYSANTPSEGELFGVTTAIAPCPWNPENQLLRLTLQAPITVTEGGNNLVFLIDVSGSMNSEDKLPLFKTSFSYLVNQLTAEDRVSIVTYSGKEEVILTGCPGSDKQTILEAVNNLSASGMTNGEAGLQKAYQIASDYRIIGGNNRIIMASDGDLNVGISSASELKSYVETKRDEGIFLSVLGFGTGNYRDSNMEALADNGNGVYYYIDGESEAKKVFGDDLLSTLYTVAKDVKLQLTFDPTYVTAYRQIGYENRQLQQEDFDDDTKDAGEVGAGHQVTVFYELQLSEKAATENADANSEWMKLAVRYKEPTGDVSKLNEYSIGAADRKEADSDFRFMVCVIEAVMVLRESRYLGDVTMETVLAQLNSLDFDGYPYRAEFRSLIEAITL